MWKPSTIDPEQIIPAGAIDPAPFVRSLRIHPDRKEPAAAGGESGARISGRASPFRFGGSIARCCEPRRFHHFHRSAVTVQVGAFLGKRRLTACLRSTPVTRAL